MKWIAIKYILKIYWSDQHCTVVVSNVSAADSIFIKQLLQVGSFLAISKLIHSLSKDKCESVETTPMKYDSTKYLV